MSPRNLQHDWETPVIYEERRIRFHWELGH